jgi:hypothetical protein
MLLPLAIGLFVKARYDATAARVKRPLDWLSNVSRQMMAFVFIWLYLGSPAEPRGAREFAADGVDFITDFGALTPLHFGPIAESEK